MSRRKWGRGSLTSLVNSFLTAVGLLDASGDPAVPPGAQPIDTLLTDLSTLGDTLAAGDVVYADAVNSLARLAKGSDTEVLTLASGVPSWAAPGGGGGTAQGVDGTYDIQPANEGSTAGNARGENSVDLQTSRSAATQVASGANSLICGGQNNLADATRSSVCGGLSNDAGGTNSHVSGGQANSASHSDSFVGGGSSNTAGNSQAFVGGGNGNSATGTRSAIPGGDSNTASGDYSSVSGGILNSATEESSFVPGGNRAKADRYGELAHSAGILNVVGDAQRSVLQWRNNIYPFSAVFIDCYLDGLGASKRMVLAADDFFLMSFHGLLVASDGSIATFIVDDVIAYRISSGNIVVVNGGTTIAASSNVNNGTDMSGCQIYIAADTSNQAVRVRLLGVAFVVSVGLVKADCIKLNK
jgi:hypothetical protein